MKKGKFIVIEGIGGCGKDTQVDLISEHFRKLKLDFVVTREHTRDTPPGVLIERIIKKDEAQIDPLALQILFSCDRRNHYMKVIKKALDDGKIVVGNRYYPTTVAYSQKAWRKLILDLNQSIVPRPDLVIIIDTNPEIAAERVVNRGDADIFDKSESLKQCRKGYMWYKNNSRDKVVLVDGNGTKEEVFERVKNEIKRRKII